MADSFGGGSSDGFWQAQTELARSVNRLAEQVGSVSAQLEQRVTHKELMQEFGGFRKESAAKLDHMEIKFDEAAKNVEATLDRAIDRIKDNLSSMATKAVGEALATRDAQELKALTTVQRNESELERKIKQANRNSLIGGGVGILGVAAAIAQAIIGGGH